METAYTYDDIQIVPIYSDIQSRSDCNLKSRITKNYEIDIPIISAPMDTVTEIDMALELYSLGGYGCIHRFMSIEEQVKQCSKVQEGGVHSPRVIAAIGATGDYQERAKELISAGVKILLIDVAHGNTIQVMTAIDWCKVNLPSYVDIIAGNVATYEGTKNLIAWGADAIRVGIGGGCFTPNMRVKTDSGYIKIKDIQIGTNVFSHTGKLQRVSDKIEYDRDESIVCINDIECTENHEFYVIPIDLVNDVTENNIHELARWIPAGELSYDYFLIELE